MMMKAPFDLSTVTTHPVYRAEIRENGRIVARLSDTDAGDLESQIQQTLRDITRKQQQRNLFAEVRVRYV